MTKTLKLFSLLLMVVFSVVFADSNIEKYRLYVTEVDPEFHCFSLSNKMVLNIPKRNWETIPLPEVGTEIYFKPDSRAISSSDNEDEILVGYSQDPSKKIFSVWITPESKQNWLSCISSETICTAPAGWISSAECHEALLLSDGSQWIKENDRKTAFGPESRLVICKQKDGGFMIMDLDASSYTCKCRTQQRSGKTLTWHRYERVNPYVPTN